MLLTMPPDYRKEFVVSSYLLSFFQPPVTVSRIEIFNPFAYFNFKKKIQFGRVCRKLEPVFSAATLRSIALNYIQRKGPALPRALLRAMNQLMRRDDIIILKPDKGSGMVY